MRSLHILLSLLLAVFLLIGSLSLLQPSEGMAQEPATLFSEPPAETKRPSFQLPSPELPHASAQVIVKFREDNLLSHQMVEADLGVRQWEQLFTVSQQELQADVAHALGMNRIYRLQLAPGSDVNAAVETLNRNPDVVYAEPNYLGHAAFDPDDPHYVDQWGLSQIAAPAAWDVTQGSPAIAIAVIDTGVALSHPDLVGKLWQNPGEIAENGIDDDGNGKVDDVHGWDWVGTDNIPEDDIGHGTHVAGIAAAATDNGAGIAGVCPACRVMPLKVLDAGGSGSYSDIANSIYYAADKGARVINLSLGGYADSQLLRDAVAYASEFSTIVAAAGNDNRQEPFYPAAYDEYVIAVAATDNSDAKTAFSNYGSWVDISAPGVSIWSTVVGDSYAAWSGSSMAAPFVSGVAGLIHSQHPGWSAGAVRGQLLHTTSPVDVQNPSYEGKLGSGRLDAEQALTTTAQPEVMVVGHAVAGIDDGSPEPGSTVTLTIILENRWLDIIDVTVTLTTESSLLTITDGTANYGSLSGYQPATNDNDPFIITLDDTTPFNQRLPLTLTLQTSDGLYHSSLPFTLTASTSIQYVNGLIEQDTVWEGGREYLLTGDLTIRPGYTLTIQPGSTVRGVAGAQIAVQGRLYGQGTPGEEISFAADNSSWSGLTIDGGTLDLTYCSIRQAEIAVYLLNEPTVQLDNCLIGDNITGIEDKFPYSSYATILTVSNSQFINNATGIWVNYATTTIDNVEIIHNAQGIVIDGSATLSISDSQMIDNDKFGIWLNQGPKGVIERNYFTNNGIGLRFESYNTGGPISLTSNTFVDNGRGIQIGHIGSGSISTYYNNLIRNKPYSFYNHLGDDHDISDHYWGTTDIVLIEDMIYDIHDDGDAGQLFYSPVLTQPVATAPTFLKEVAFIPEGILSTGYTEMQLDFSKEMFTSVQPTVTFGISPTNDTHFVAGSWVSSTRWAGSYDVTYYTGDGVQQLRVAGAVGADGMEVPEDTTFSFEIATIGATSVNAEPSFGQVALSWEPSELDTVAGYNIYRSTSSGGPYTRLNDSVLTTTGYTDTEVSNGTTYYYVLRLLTTDLHESDYGSEVGATPNDFTAPTTPVVIDDGSCTPYTDKLHATWSANDPESGIDAYEVSIGSWAGGSDVVSWMNVGASTELTRTGLSLIEGVTYYINVKAQNGVGTWSEVGSSDGILVSSGCPVAAFMATPTSGNRPLTVSFTEQITGTADERLWDFGDGTMSTELNPSHTYNMTGQFTVTLAVTGTAGSNVLVKPAYIMVNEPPTAAFSATPTAGLAPLIVAFTDESTGDVDSWAWDFGDGATSNETSPSHTYDTAGVYTVTLTVSGPGGGDVSEQTITVYEPVVAAFSVTPTAGPAPLAVAFSNNSAGDYNTSEWDFGDGTTSNEANPHHIYEAIGTYTVSLTVTGPGGEDQLVKEGLVIVSLDDHTVFLPTIVR